jgi:hypothetical protein
MVLSPQDVLTALGDDYWIIQMIDVSEVTPFVFTHPNNGAGTEVALRTCNSHSTIDFVGFEVIALKFQNF